MAQLEVLIVFALIVVVFIFLGLRGRERDERPQPRPEPVSPWGTQLGGTQTQPRPHPIPRVAPRPEKQILTGPAYVTDGDGLRIQKTELRLFGIDAPEFAHPYGKQAKWALLGLCKGQTVRAEVICVDNHGRTVAKCYLPDGRDLSAEMVKLGLALDWAKFSGGIYRNLETADARKKLWLADARQKGHMHLWVKFEAQQIARKAAKNG